MVCKSDLHGRFLAGRQPGPLCAREGAAGSGIVAHTGITHSERLCRCGLLIHLAGKRNRTGRYNCPLRHGHWQPPTALWPMASGSMRSTPVRWDPCALTQRLWGPWRSGLCALAHATRAAPPGKHRPESIAHRASAGKHRLGSSGRSLEQIPGALIQTLGPIPAPMGVVPIRGTPSPPARAAVTAEATPAEQGVVSWAP
jgi:hypothetical protein